MLGASYVWPDPELDLETSVSFLTEPGLPPGGCPCGEAHICTPAAARTVGTDATFLSAGSCPEENVLLDAVAVLGDLPSKAKLMSAGILEICKTPEQVVSPLNKHIY